MPQEKKKAEESAKQAEENNAVNSDKDELENEEGGVKATVEEVSRKAKEFTSSVKETFEGSESNRLFAALGYIPVLGWILPYFFKREDELCQFHGKQSFVFSIFFIIMMTVVWIVENLPILSHLLSWIGIKAFLVPLLLYGTLLIYLGASAYAAYKAFQDEIWEIPYLGKFRSFILNFFTNNTPEKPEE